MKQRQRRLKPRRAPRKMLTSMKWMKGEARDPMTGRLVTMWTNKFGNTIVMRRLSGGRYSVYLMGSSKDRYVERTKKQALTKVKHIKGELGG